MIRNIVFDLGNVLISFKPEEYLRKKNYAEDKRHKVLSDVFGSHEWLLLDNGDITADEAITGIVSRSALSREDVTTIFSLRHEILYPLEQNTALLPPLKKAGYRLYFLSNFPADLWDHVTTKERSTYDFFRNFDGGIISAEAHASKPDLKIYNILLEKYGLDAKECFYIDDIEVNVRAAEATGMKGVVTNGMPDLRRLLSEYGLFTTEDTGKNTERSK